MKLWKKLSVGLASSMLLACSAGDDPSVQVTGVVLPDASCQLPPNPNIFRNRGLFDPAVGTTFQFTPIVTNRLTPTGANNQQFFGDDNLLAESNTLSLLGFDVCYARGDDERLSALGAFADGTPVDCEADSLFGEFVPASGTIEAGLGSFSVLIPVFGIGAQKALFGEGFEPGEVPIVGDTGGSFSLAPSPPTATNRDPNWGNFPNANSVLVYVIARAVAQRGNGSTVVSDYVAYPIDVAPGAAARQCGVLVPVTCDDGSDGLAGERLEGCSVGSFLATQCEDFSTCPPT